MFFFNSLYSYRILNKSRRGRRTSLFQDEQKVEDNNEFMQSEQMIPQIAIKKNKRRRRRKAKKVKKELLFEKVTKLYNICRTIKSFNYFFDDVFLR